MRRPESGPPKPPTREEIQERIRKLRIRVRVLRDVMALYQIPSESGKPATMLNCIEILQAEIWKRKHILEAGKATPEGKIRTTKEIETLYEQKMILDDILPKDQSILEASTDTEEELSRLEKE